MKALTVSLVVIVLVTHISGYLIKVPTKAAVKPAVTDNTGWVHLQKLMIPLFENVCETSKDPTIIRLAQEFTIFDSSDFVKPEVINNLQNLVSIGLLPKGTIFTEFNPDHMNELKIVYEVLFNAKDFNAFYKAAAWARQNLNCALYVDAIYMAIQTRRDMNNFRLSIPGPYELLPNYFIDKYVIMQAAMIFSKDKDCVVPEESIHSEGDAYVIDANYTALFYDNDDDSRLAYFREDVGLNSYYFLRKLRMAPWFNDDINRNFGENMYQMMKQLNARYNLERYANGMPEIGSISWDSPVNIPYDPMLIYSNGDEFGHRTSSIDISENENLHLLQTIENNILSVVSHLYQNGYNKTQILNHLMEIFVTSDKSYETLARQLLGKDMNNGQVSILEHYMTSLRDPVFWKINKKIIDMIDEALKVLPTYDRNELYFPGVEVVNIEVKKLTTACDYFIFDVTDALKINEDDLRIKIGQPRLNHKQFTIKVNISSLVSQKGLMKIYLGPKLMPGELADKKNLFTLLDVFEINLKIGSNIITRSSDNMNHFSEDFLQLNAIRKKIEDAEFGLDSLPLKTIQSQVGYPSRLILPRGTLQGLPLQIFVFVAPFIKASLEDSYVRNSLEFNTAILSPGYPLDLMIEARQLFGLPNAMTKYFTVLQKGESKVENYGGPGETKSWYGTNTYDPSSKPNYNSKNGKYGGKKDYAGKGNKYNMATNDIVSEETLDDDYNVIELQDKPDFDVSSNTKLNKPFDYRAKKAQFDKKDFGTKRDYTKYRTTTKDDKDIVTTAASNIMASTEREVDKPDILRDVNINTEKDMDIVDNLQQEQSDFLEVEPLPSPAMLKNDTDSKEKIDYKLKKKERSLLIKGKKVKLDNLIKDAKMKRYKKLDDDSSEKIYFDSEGVKDNENFKDAVKLDSKVANKQTLKPLNKHTTIPDIKVLDSEENIGKINLSKDNIKYDSSNLLDQDTMADTNKNIKENTGTIIISKDSIKLDNQNIEDIFDFEKRIEIAHSTEEQPTHEASLLEIIRNSTPNMYKYLTNTLDSDESSETEIEEL